MGEIDRRERVYGIAEKLPKHASASSDPPHGALGDAAPGVVERSALRRDRFHSSAANGARRDEPAWIF